MANINSIPAVDFHRWRFWAEELLNQEQSGDFTMAELDKFLQYAGGIDRLSLRLGLCQDNSPIQLSCDLSQLSRLWQQRVTERVPLQYLVGWAGWRQFTLQVTPGVLIPRPETEVLVDWVQEEIRKGKHDQGSPTGNWADLGTGSGAIAIGLCSIFPNITLHAVDCSEVALAMAKVNAQQNGLEHRIQFYHGEWFEPLHHLEGNLQGMVSNPPYILTHQLSGLQPEVARHEPWLALDGGSDGLDCIRILIKQGAHYLCPGGLWVVECMAGQALTITQLLHHQGDYGHIHIAKDWEGIERFVIARRQF